MGILAAAEFEIISKINRLKVHSPGQLVSGLDMVLPIKHKVDWELMRKRKHLQINKHNIRKKIKRDKNDYKVGDKFMLNNSAAYKY